MLLEVVNIHRQTHMKTLEQATTRELEIAQVNLAIAETDAGIIRMETALAAMRQKQTARHREVVRQETLARCSNDPSSPTAGKKP